MKVILCCLVLFILLACPVSAAISPLPAATKAAIAISTPTPNPTLTLAGFRTVATTATPAQHTFWTFMMTSNPSGARVYVFGNATDTITPWFEIIPSTYHNPYPMIFVLKYPGYEDYIFEPVLFTGENVTLHADMIPLPVTTQPVTDQATIVPPTGTIPQTTAPTPQATQEQITATGTWIPVIASSGSLSVTTSPAGAEISIDDGFKGVSPATIAGLSAGTHTLGIVKEGYRNITTTIIIDPGQTREYSTGLIAATTPATTTSAKTPGFSALPAVAILSVLFIIGKRTK